MKLEGYDWEQAFDVSGVTRLPGHEHISKDRVSLSDVDHAVFAVEGENDGPSWIAVGKLNDGRWFSIDASCCYTGWDCQGGGIIEVADSFDSVMASAVSKDMKERFGVS